MGLPCRHFFAAQARQKHTPGALGEPRVAQNETDACIALEQQLRLIETAFEAYRDRLIRSAAEID